MVKIWYLDESDPDLNYPNQGTSPKFIDIEELNKCSKVQYFEIDLATLNDPDSQYQQIRKERGYNYEDSVDIRRDKLPNYDEMVGIFAKEHLHADEEIRLITDGSAYFDVRDSDHRYIRIQVVKGDLIILPAGIYHRLCMDKNEFVKANRLFQGEPVWTPHFYPADDHPARQQYLKSHAA